ncbi:MAG: hypothetical protein LBK59_09130, partial [Bifidobacteriaceae bacterium]|nr:hypothetical protein [Bifidobacteriaceae bacterium]
MAPPTFQPITGRVAPGRGGPRAPSAPAQPLFPQGTRPPTGATRAPESGSRPVFDSGFQPPPAPVFPIPGGPVRADPPAIDSPSAPPVHPTFDAAAPPAASLPLAQPLATVPRPDPGAGDGAAGPPDRISVFRAGNAAASGQAAPGDIASAGDAPGVDGPRPPTDATASGSLDRESVDAG